MTILLLLRLLISHLFTDFVIQPSSWVKDRKLNKWRSTRLLLHVTVTTLFAYLFSGLYSCWWLPLVIFVSHYLIDLCKSYLPDNFSYFIADQLLHVAVIILIWLRIEGQWPDLSATVSELTLNNRFWILTFGYLLVTWPMGIVIGIATAPWRDELDTTMQGKEGLANAGKWIGICERILILTFVLTAQYTAIGFLITAKSILRFGEKDKNAEKKTEYILVGTLLSFMASVLLGMGLRHLLH